ncbi:hypothetical protein WJX77_007629 [Trebouxia sp. C0004]
MIPFNGTDEIISLVNECSNLSIGLMNLSSFQQWSSNATNFRCLHQYEHVPGSSASIETILPAGTALAWGPFSSNTCISYQHNSSLALITGLLNDTSFTSWDSMGPFLLSRGLPAQKATAP